MKLNGRKRNETQKIFTYFFILHHKYNCLALRRFPPVVMLYISLGSFWLYAAFSDKYRDSGILILALFCGGLVSGRVLSVLIDGLPSPILLVYIFMELSLIPVCIWLLRRQG